MMRVEDCPDPDDLVAWAEDPSSDLGETIAAHVRRCDECNAAVASLRAPASDPGPGRRPVADRYLLQTVLDQGGRGVICVARDLLLHRRVAIKLARFDDEPAELLHEAAAQASFSNPYVLSVLDAGRDLDHTFVVVEYVDGADASVACLAPGFSTRTVRDIIGDAARGLEALHREGLVHGDVTPRNLLVGHDGRTRLIDFGSASPESVVRMGTPGFTAPETRRGEVTPVSDQYGLGMTLAALLLYAEDSSPTLQRVARRATDPDPRRRYPSIAAFASALQRHGWRDAVPAVALAAVAMVVAPEGPPDLDARWMDTIEEAAIDALHHGGPPAARAFIDRANAIAERTHRPAMSLRAAMLAARIEFVEGGEQQLELELAAARLAQRVDDPSLRVEALLSLATSDTLSFEAATVMLELAEAAAEELAPDDAARMRLPLARAVVHLDDDSVPLPEPTPDREFAVDLMQLYRQFGAESSALIDPQCEALEGAYIQGECYTMLAAAHFMSADGVLEAQTIAPAGRYAQLALERLEPIVGADHCELMLPLIIRGTTSMPDDWEAAERDIGRGLGLCSDLLPEERVDLELLWARALVHTGAVAQARTIADEARTTQLGKDGRELLTLVDAALASQTSDP